MIHDRNRLPLFLPFQLRSLSMAGRFATERNNTDLYPSIRLWFPTMGLYWVLTHSSPDEPDLTFGLAINRDADSYELGWWSIDAFEQFGRGPYDTALRSSSVFSYHAPISLYIRSIIAGAAKKKAHRMRIQRAS